MAVSDEQRWAMNRQILIVDEGRGGFEHLCGELPSTAHRLEVRVSAESAWASIDRDLQDVANGRGSDDG